MIIHDLVASSIDNFLSSDIYLDDFTKNALSLVYPAKFLKRIIYRPFGNQWFPYIDVVSEGYDLQQSFFFGKVMINFSQERYCSICGNKITSNFLKVKIIPVSLCSNCFSRIYYGYWECISSVIRNLEKFQDKSLFKRDLIQTNFERDLIKENFKDNDGMVVCENFFKPRCGFPLRADLISPCFKNHGIGIVVKNSFQIQILIGALDFLKYKMIQEGGLLGLILGYQNKILNLRQIGEILMEIKREIEYYTERYNQSIINNKDDDKKNFFYTGIIRYDYDSYTKPSFVSPRSLKEWTILSFLRYYPNFGVKHFLKIYFKSILNYLEGLIKILVIKLGLDVLDFIKLYKIFPPLSSGVRQRYLKKLLNCLGINTISEFSFNLIEVKFNNFSQFLNNFNLIKYFNLDDYDLDFDIYEIHASFGQYLIAETNLFEDLITINIRDLLGRQII